MAGKIVHFELPSGDADRASAFYSGLFGWQIAGSVMEGFDYRMFQASDDQGRAEDKQPVPTHGWFAACKDTEGNSFSLWQADPNAA